MSLPRAIPLALIGAAAACVARAPACPATLRPTVEPLVLVASSTIACRNDDPELPLVQDEARQLAEVLARLFPGAIVRELGDPDPACLQGAIAAARGALTVIYTGHGEEREGRSGVCLRGNQWVPLESLVAAAAGATYATFLINACRSAEIALRRPNAVTITASPDDAQNQHAETVLGRWLLEGFRAEVDQPGSVDLDHNGVVDSGELFALVNRAVSGDDPVMPKQQSQAWTRLPVISRAAGLATGELPGWLQGPERDLRTGRAAPPIDEPLTVWAIAPEAAPVAPVRAAHRLSAEDARAIAASSLAVLPIGVSSERGELVAQNMRTREVLWRREVAAGGALFRDADLDAVLWGFEPLGNRRRYVRPLRRTEWDDLDRSGWRPVSCRESTGQCFERGGRQGDAP